MSREFQPPHPSRPLMWLLGYINRWFLLLGLPILRRVPIIQNLPGIRGYFWLREIDLPAPDRERLQRAVNPATAAFIGPNHPEFGFDWMMEPILVDPTRAELERSGYVSALVTMVHDRMQAALADTPAGKRRAPAHDIASPPLFMNRHVPSGYRERKVGSL